MPGSRQTATPPKSPRDAGAPGDIRQITIRPHTHPHTTSNPGRLARGRPPRHRRARETRALQGTHTLTHTITYHRLSRWFVRRFAWAAQSGDSLHCCRPCRCARCPPKSRRNPARNPARNRSGSHPFLPLLPSIVSSPKQQQRPSDPPSEGPIRGSIKTARFSVSPHTRPR